VPQVRKTPEFEQWFTSLRDRAAQRRIQARIDRLEIGNAGQGRALTGGVSEMKIDFGPGYRVYYTQRGTLLVILLCGGDKSTQTDDIKTALKMAQNLE
jgi:putative addiction module killer protein